MRISTSAYRAIEIAASGHHHILFIGPKTSGIARIGEFACSILPMLTPDEAMEVSAIHRQAGLLDDKAVLAEPPFRFPHHSISEKSFMGGRFRRRRSQFGQAWHLLPGSVDGIPP